MNGLDTILANGKPGNVEKRSAAEAAIGRKKRKG
jgi:hypothetical protein